MSEFMVLVERAVRPVAAGPARKMRMREELLAHLTGIYEQELARLGDEAAARAEAVRRFGNPTELTAELTGSLGWRDRVDYRIDRWFGWRPGQSVVRWALRQFALAGLIILPLLLFSIATAEYRRPETANIPTAGDLARMWAATFLFGTAGVVLVSWLAVKVRRTLFGANPSRVRAAGYAALLALVTPVMAGGFYLVAVWDVPGVLGLLSPSDPGALVANCAAALLVPVLAVVFARWFEERAARRLEWARLDLAG